MSILNIRHNGDIISISEGFNFTPQNYGTARLKIRVNSTSKMIFGLTTNTNAQEYCKLKVRFNNQVAYIGRISTLSYISGETVDYKGSTYVSRTESILTVSNTRNQGSGSYTSPTAVDINTITNQTGSTVTTNTILNTAMYTNNPGSGNGTAATDPTIHIVTNATGSSYTTRTASANIASQTWYTFTQQAEYRKTSSTMYITRNFPSPSANTIASKTPHYVSNCTTFRSISYIYGTNYNSVTQYIKQASQTQYQEDTSSFSKTTSRNSRNSSKQSESSTGSYGNIVTVSSIANYTGIPAALDPIETKLNSTYQTQTRYTSITQKVSASVYTMSSRNTWTRVLGYVEQYETFTPQAVQTWYRSSKRWSYWWTSCQKNTTSTWDVYWTSCEKYTNSTISVTETCHNINL